MRYVMIALLLCTGCAFKLWPMEVAFAGGSVSKKGVESSQPAGEVLSFILRILDAVPGVEIGDADPLPETVECPAMAQRDDGGGIALMPGSTDPDPGIPMTWTYTYPPMTFDEDDMSGDIDHAVDTY